MNIVEIFFDLLKKSCSSSCAKYSLVIFLYWLFSVQPLPPIPVCPQKMYSPLKYLLLVWFHYVRYSNPLLNGHRHHRCHHEWAFRLGHMFGWAAFLATADLLSDCLCLLLRYVAVVECNQSMPRQKKKNTYKIHIWNCYTVYGGATATTINTHTQQLHINYVCLYMKRVSHQPPSLHIVANNSHIQRTGTPPRRHKVRSTDARKEQFYHEAIYMKYICGDPCARVDRQSMGGVASSVDGAADSRLWSQYIFNEMFVLFCLERVRRKQLCCVYV